MKIKGKGDVDILELHHKGANTRFQSRVQPFGLPDLPQTKEESIATIQFDDVYEVDALIKMLREFKDANYRYFGDWRKLPEW